MKYASVSNILSKVIGCSAAVHRQHRYSTMIQAVIEYLQYSLGVEQLCTYLNKVTKLCLINPLKRTRRPNNVDEKT